MKHQGGTHEEVRVYCKGAPEIILEKCKLILDSNGRSINLDEVCHEDSHQFLNSHEQEILSNREVIEAAISHYTKQAFRTILFAYKDMSLSEFQRLKPDALEESMTVVGLFALMDPLKPSVPASIQIVKRAGIQVVMCTGDNLETAKAIAKNSGIITTSDLAEIE